MSSSNRTDNLNLSQFSSNDKPGWLSDYNADMKHIDDHVGAAAAGLAAHTADKANPHGVTARQVGAYTKGEANLLLDAKASLELQVFQVAAAAGFQTLGGVTKNAFGQKSINIGISRTTAMTSGMTIATLPEGARPSHTVQMICPAFSSTGGWRGHCYLLIYTDGKIDAYFSETAIYRVVINTTYY